MIILQFPCTWIVYICSVLRHYFPYWALDCCCSNIKLDGCDIASFNQRWLVSDQKVTDFSNFPQAQNTMGLKSFFSIMSFKYRMLAIISCGLYFFYPVFHSDLYCRVVCSAERLIICIIKSNRYLMDTFGEVLRA